MVAIKAAPSKEKPDTATVKVFNLDCLPGHRPCRLSIISENKTKENTIPIQSFELLCLEAEGPILRSEFSCIFPTILPLMLLLGRQILDIQTPSVLLQDLVCPLLHSSIHWFRLLMAALSSENSWEETSCAKGMGQRKLIKMEFGIFRV